MTFCVCWTLPSHENMQQPAWRTPSNISFNVLMETLKHAIQSSYVFYTKQSKLSVFKITKLYPFDLYHVVLRNQYQRNCWANTLETIIMQLMSQVNNENCSNHMLFRKFSSVSTYWGRIKEDSFLFEHCVNSEVQEIWPQFKLINGHNRYKFCIKGMFKTFVEKCELGN